MFNKKRDNILNRIKNNIKKSFDESAARIAKETQKKAENFNARGMLQSGVFLSELDKLITWSKNRQ